MNIKLAYTDRGVLMGDFTEELGSPGSWTVDNPVFVNIGQNNVALVPFLSIAEEKQVRLTSDDIHFGGLFTPVTDLRNHYSSQFGSGIQLVSG